MLPLHRTWVQSLIRELRSHMPWHGQKLKNKTKMFWTLEGPFSNKSVWLFPEQHIPPALQQQSSLAFLISALIRPGWWWCSVTQSCPTLGDTMDCSTPGFPVLRHLPEFAQTHVHCIGEAIQPSHPLSSPSPPTFNLSQHQDLFQWVSQLHQVAKSTGDSPSASVLPMNIQGWCPLGWTGWISLQSKGLSRVFFSTTIWKDQFFSAYPSLWSNSHIHTWLLEKP